MKANENRFGKSCWVTRQKTDSGKTEPMQTGTHTDETQVATIKTERPIKIAGKQLKQNNQTGWVPIFCLFTHSPTL